MIIPFFKNTYNFIKLKRLNKKGTSDYFVYIVLGLVSLIIILYLIFNWRDIADRFSSRLSNLGGHKYD